MNPAEYPLILSPNLGCPQIISLEKMNKGTKFLTLIIAGEYGEFASPTKEKFEGAFKLTPSYNGEGYDEEIDLIIDGFEEITGWNQVPNFAETEGTMTLISSELHYEVFEEKTRYWKIDTKIQEGIEFSWMLRKQNNVFLPTLYDLLLIDPGNNQQKVNYHAVQLVEKIKKDFQFIHLTDIHLAKRNDEILDEVLKVKHERNGKEIRSTYQNFNHNFRKFIKTANELADKGELDFVIIGGDVVDFAFHGWDNQEDISENNWKIFINMATGRGNEGSVEFFFKKEDNEVCRGNPGIKVAIFTSTGNHDWRLHPYDPKLGNYNETFGLTKEELKHYEYKSFDSTEYPEDKRAKLAEEIKNKAFNKLNLDAFTNKWQIKAAKFLSGKVAKWIPPIIGLGSAGGAHLGKLQWVISTLVFGVVWLVVWGLKKYLEHKTRQLVDLLLDNPLHAEARALHYYFKHINPYFDYAFRYGNHHFIIMDTGCDVFIGQLLYGKEINRIKRVSIEDNIIGMSPDSRAFDSEQAYYNWSQIVWLEKVLASIHNQINKQCNIFICLHSPPINPDKKIEWKSLWEHKRKEQKWISKEECNLTYGSIVHYLSQFFYLCLGQREGELSKNLNNSTRNVNLVLSGHTHRNMEFRIKLSEKNDIRIYSDVYSQWLLSSQNNDWWGKYGPIIVQTAACGLSSNSEKHPPYFRKIIVNAKGEIESFQVFNIKGAVDFK